MELFVEQLWNGPWFVYRKLSYNGYVYIWKDGTPNKYTKKDHLSPAEDASEGVGAYHESLDKAYKWANKMGFKLKIYYPE